ncbi:MAG: pseudouridine synthase [Spongiibacteraceae bacterium]
MTHSIASSFVLPPGEWRTVLDCLCANFPAIGPERWRARFLGGRILDEHKQPLDVAHAYRTGMRIYYFREVPDEKPIPFFESIIYADDHLIVADKPHFLPVTPVGEYVEQTLLARLIKHFDNTDIAPLHRIDRHTAGLVLFSAQRSSRAAYQALFRDRNIEKVYEAIAPALPHLEFPVTRQSRIVRGEPFFLSREIKGDANAETRIEVINRHRNHWHYRLYPVTGKKHQLRVHMAALGAPIENDAFYPQVRDELFDDYAQPLQLLARELRFIDPLSGRAHHFVSPQKLKHAET